MFNHLHTSNYKENVIRRTITITSSQFSINLVGYVPDFPGNPDNVLNS